MKATLAIRLTGDLLTRLSSLAKRTGRTKTFYAREAIFRYLDEMEDTFVAIQRIEKPGKRMSMKDAEKALGLDS
jgi:RHH-type rel operon transcriptional repressor/antitoxin RelB